MKVKIIKAGQEWYKNQVGSIFNVHPSNDSYYPLVGVNLIVYKSDCEILPAETPQPEPFDLDRLFMAPKEPKVVTKWLNIFSNGGELFYTDGSFFSNKETAESCHTGKHNYLGAFPVQITLP